ncbi:RNA-binding S4 domain-containing protein [Vibrio fluvialis]|uniref:RNA-binding S4 domain-containing protein n=1 Tax=Vibrio fluvialis TaxID=676 RepID=UPI001ABDC448|nr:RNA-binding S4 domain-containing protein [Vibrio fluvialis]QTH07181.1 RNA-binding S4 domain-containing protein [Vibrio fluvialis]QTH11204.1 RNA-binding S4 domain-containing protein [Vibrio fluvialis]
MNEFENPQWEDEEVEIEAIGIEVDAQPIELYKVLKIANAVSGGGEAKYAIAEGYVAVNGELEMRKRRKLYDGDLVEFNEEYYLIICDAPVTEVEEKPKAPAPKKKPSNKPAAGKKSGSKASKLSQSASKNNKAKAKASKESEDDQPKDSKGGRNAISFF